MFKKFKKQFKRFMTGKSGFSLVELIVVIAIMAVMAAVLAPALLGYVERSRAQKDSSAMDEAVNSVQLSLADQDVYDEMLKYSAEQYSCYVDSDTPGEANKVELKAGKYFTYSDEERKLDETVYKLDGVMRGVTITFAPDAASSNKATFDLIKGHVNKYLPSGKKTYGGLTGANASPQLSAITDSELYNSLRATIGDKITINSQTYRNSEYTIFISMGTTGGNQADMQDAIKVWGQWSGTNLPEGSSVATNGASNPGTNAGSNEFQGTTQPNAPEVIEAGAIFTKCLKSTTCHAEYYEHTDNCFEECPETFLTWQELQLEENIKKHGYNERSIGDSFLMGTIYSRMIGMKQIILPESLTILLDWTFEDVPEEGIIYLGTVEQWNQIEFDGEWWGGETRAFTVTCSDDVINF